MPERKLYSRRDALRIGATAAGGGALAVLGGEALISAITGQARATANPGATAEGQLRATANPGTVTEKTPGIASRPATVNWEPVDPKEALQLGWTDGKYQTFPRQVMAIDGVEGKILQEIDLGTLGPDVDTIVGIDFVGDIPTGAAIAHQPTEGEILETRVVFIKRTDLETVQLSGALGGDRFDIYKASKHGGDHALDVTARLHAQNTAREHQKVVYLGDLGLFEKQWGEGEKPLLNAIIRAQRPAAPNIGIQEPDFVQQRVFRP